MSAAALLPALQLRAMRPKEVAELGAAACSLPGGSVSLWLPCKHQELAAAGLSLAA